MKNFFVFFLVFVAVVFSETYAQTEYISNRFLISDWLGTDTVYTLPGEEISYQIGLQSMSSTRDILGFNFFFSTNADGNFLPLAHGSYLGGVFTDTTYPPPGIRYVANWVSEAEADSGINGMIFVDMNYVNNYPVGNLREAYTAASGIFWDNSGPVTDFCYSDKYFVTIDRLRGDINGDGVVDSRDLKIYNDYLTYWTSGERYTDGINVGAGICLFNYPNLVDEYLMSLWLSHPDNAYVSGEGWGQPMSSIYAGADPVGKAVPYSLTATGSQLNIQTAAFAVGISGRLPNGKVWQSAAFVKDGRASVSLPTGLVDVKVEAKSFDGVTAINKADNQPKDFSLQQNYPNPFNPTTTISYSLPKAALVTLKVYDMLGREVASLVNEERSAGSYDVKFDASRLASGTYIYRLTAGTLTQIKKMILMK